MCRNSTIRKDYNRCAVLYSFRILIYLLQEIIDHFNYALFFPPSKGKAGKFLDEDRTMKDYGLTGSVDLLEVIINRKRLLISFDAEHSNQTNCMRLYLYSNFK